MRWRECALVGAAVAFGLVGCGDDGSAPERLVAYGHSWVAGRSPDPTVEPWPERVADELGIPGENRGMPAAESPAIADRVLAADHRCGDVVVLEPVLNDVRRWGEDERALRRFRRELRRMLDHLDDVAVVVVIDPPIPGWSFFPPYDHGSDRALARYRDVVDDEATDEEVVDLAEGWERDLMSPDAIHPDDAGTSRVAHEVAAAVRRLPASCRDG